MKKLKKVLRVLGLLVLLLLALSGIGIVGVFFSNNRERYLNKKIMIEMVDKMKDEAESQITDQFKIRE